MAEMRNEDFEEEDVWALVKNRDGDSCMRPWSIKDSSSSSAWHIHADPRVIPRATPPPHDARTSHGHHQSSAPVNVPDWSKIYKKNKNAKKEYGVYDDDDGVHGHDDDGVHRMMVPPHEYIARKLARTQISSSSMCEGVGRTLKGRDLSKVRNAILTKTGFLE